MSPPPPAARSGTDPRRSLDDKDGEDKRLSNFLLLLSLLLLLPPLVFVTLLKLVADSEGRRRRISYDLPLLWLCLLFLPLGERSLGEDGLDSPPLTLLAATSRREAAADPTPILTVEAEAAVLSAKGGGTGEESGVSTSFLVLLLPRLMGWGLPGLWAKRRSRKRCLQAGASDPKHSNAKILDCQEIVGFIDLGLWESWELLGL